MRFTAGKLPDGVHLDAVTGILTGKLARPGDYPIAITVSNALGQTTRILTLKVGKDIALTPPMGWNSYNIWGTNVDQTKALEAARGMAESGLADHGWTYINVDDGWQGTRDSNTRMLLPDPKRFPDIEKLSAQVHDLGLKFGIYHTPWVTSYGGRVGGSSENEDGAWGSAEKGQNVPRNRKTLPFAIGKYHFDTQDAQQFAKWQVDYLKFDWAPIEAPETKEMNDALIATGRDVVFSLSNNATNSLLKNIASVRPYANLWRTNGDINDTWNSVKSQGFSTDAWAPYTGPGHVGDPDMMVVGSVGWGHGHPSGLTPDEQYSHVSLWCMLAAPLLLGNDMTKLDAFTRGLLTNDEVLDLDQDSLVKRATEVWKSQPADGDLRIYAKPLEGGDMAVGIFNLGDSAAILPAKATDSVVKGQWNARDVWRQQDVGEFRLAATATIPKHGVLLLRLSSKRSR